MFSTKVEVLVMARALAAHAASRQGIIARNMANADTPGFRARDLASFASVWRDKEFEMRQTRAAHAPGEGRVRLDPVSDSLAVKPNGNSVSVEGQMVKAAEARQSHDLALAVQRSLSGAIRATLGRR